MGSKSDYLEAAILDHCLGGPDFTRPATVYIALFTVTPSDSGGGTEVPALYDYARVAVTNNATNWPAASGTSPTTKANGTDIVFPTANGGSWGTVVAFAIMSLATGGNILYWGAVSPTRTITDGVTARFAAGALVCTED